MTRSATIHATIDRQTKEKAQGILGKLGMSMSEAILVYFRQIVLQEGLPFQVKMPNETTVRAITDIEKGTGLHEASSVAEMVKELES